MRIGNEKGGIDIEEVLVCDMEIIQYFSLSVIGLNV